MNRRWQNDQKVLRNPERKKRKFLAKIFLILPVFGFILLGAPLIQGPLQGVTPASPTSNADTSPLIVDPDDLRFRWDFSPSFRTIEEGKFVEDLDPQTRLVYTLDPTLQQEMETLFANFHVPYGVFVAMDPGTGRILAMVEYSEESPSERHLALRATYPAASIFKLVTASAAMEKGKVGPNTIIRYRGGMHEMNPRNWRDNPKRDRNAISFSDALARSCNVAFAKVALRWLKANDLNERATLFGFNHDIGFEMPVEMSQATLRQQDDKSLAMTAAGFGNVGLSPLHGAMIAAMIANGGVMMAPRLVEKVLQNGEEVYSLKEKVLGRSMRQETAEKLSTMMAQTVQRGTSKHAFLGWSRLPSLREIRVGGKTGSLEGDNPPGDYNWFVGMAPVGSAKIAVAALVINHDTWHIKASYVAREGLKTYFQRSIPFISQNPTAGSKTGSEG
jgi:cell division protein FtsI/penicillin-binding protein 2